MNDERIIKKYPNRRLYDTKVSKYITLSDVHDLVMSRTRFRVVDATNDTDITRSILLQIMLEGESGGEPLFTAGMLAQIIRFYGGTLHGMFARYLEGSLDLFAKNQQKIAETWSEKPLETVTRVTQRNMDLWADIHREIMRSVGLDLEREKKKSKDEPSERP